MSLHVSYKPYPQLLRWISSFFPSWVVFWETVSHFWEPVKILLYFYLGKTFPLHEFMLVSVDKDIIYAHYSYFCDAEMVLLKLFAKSLIAKSLIAKLLVILRWEKMGKFHYPEKKPIPNINYPDPAHFIPPISSIPPSIFSIAKFWFRRITRGNLSIKLLAILENYQQF